MPRRIRKVQVLKRRKSPYWYIRFWELQRDGKTWKERWQSTKTSVKKEAEAHRRRLERDLDEGKSQQDWLWSDFSKEFMEKHANRKAADTQVAYRQCLKVFEETAKPRYLSSVTVAMLEDYANSRIKNGITLATINKDLRHVKVALRWAVRRGYRSDVPDFSGVFARIDAEPPVTVADGDFAALIQALSSPKLKLQHCPIGWWRSFLYLAYYLGLRRGELVGLTWDRVNLEAHEITVSAQTSKGRKYRVLPLQPELVTILGQWKSEQCKARQAPSEVLPWNHDTYRSLYEDWHAIQKVAGMPDGAHYVPKNFRSSCASELIRAGVPTAVVKDILGHQHLSDRQ